MNDWALLIEILPTVFLTTTLSAVGICAIYSVVALMIRLTLGKQIPLAAPEGERPSQQRLDDLKLAIQSISAGAALARKNIEEALSMVEEQQSKIDTKTEPVAEQVRRPR